MEGTGGVINHVKSLLKKQGHAVIVVAEGAGQEVRIGPFTKSQHCLPIQD
jgi:hypothetical protein